MSKLQRFLAVLGLTAVLVVAVQVAAQGAQAAVNDQMSAAVGTIQDLTVGTIEQVTTAINTQELVGVVDAVTVGTITIDGHVISIVSAEIKTALQVGELVKVHYVVAADGTWVAQDVESVLAGMVGCPEATEAATSSPEATEAATSGPEATDSPAMTEAVPNCTDAAVTMEPADDYSATREIETPEPTEVHDSQSAPEPTEVHQSDQQQSDSQSGSGDHQESEHDD